MPGKIIWLTAFVTLAYWLGSIAGCSAPGENQNFRILEEDTPMFDTSPDPERPGAAEAPAPKDQQAAGAATTDELSVTVEAAPVVTAAPKAETTDVTETVAETEPSVTGLDRSHWARIATGPDIAQIAAQPYYFEDWPLEEIRNKGTEAQPLDCPDAVGWDMTNLYSTFAQPVKFSLDLVMLPVRICTDPPRDLQARSPLDAIDKISLRRQEAAEAEPVAQ